MKRKSVTIGIFITLAVLGLVFTACSSPAGGGHDDPTSKLTINGLPGGATYTVYIFSSKTDISTYSAITTAYSSGSYQAVGGLSPSGNVFDLVGWNGMSATGAWTGSGSFSVLLLNASGSITSATNTMYSRATITFTNGNGTASFSSFTAVVYGGGTGSGTDGTLIINNLPDSADYVVGVYNHSGTINDISEWASVAQNIVAAGSGTASSSMTLYAANTAEAFTGTGSYMVALYTTTIPITVLYKTGVSFTNGCAAVDYDEMTDLLGNAPEPGNGGTKGKLTIDNLSAGSSLAITVYNYAGEITSQTELTTIQADLTKILATSIGMVSSSPANLQKYSNPLSAFDGTGTYLVIMAVNISSVRYAKQVSFTNGCAEINFNTLLNMSDLPLLPSVTDSLVEMVQINGGTFTMGSPSSEANRNNDETQHSVTLSGFYMGKYQVTQEQYQAVMGTNPSRFTSAVSGESGTPGKLPVEWVTWYDTVEFCNKLSVREGLQEVYTISGRTPASGYPITGATVTANFTKNGYRLPTEAEWEYACRAGTTTAYNTGETISDNTGWYDSNSGSKTHEVGKKTANTWGLYDMHGNVWEWCWDWYNSSYYSSSPANNPVGPETGSIRVLRGGSWSNAGRLLRSAYRHNDDPSDQNDIGIRLVRTGAGEVVTPNTHLVTFDTNGGSTVSPVTVTSGSKISAPTAPTKDGYTFGGWYKNSALTVVWDFNNDVVTTNITLYTKWIGTNINDVADIGFYLAAQTGGTSTANPIILNVAIQLTEDNWKALLQAINTSNKYVNLDLSVCTRSNSDSGDGLRSDGAFDPNRDFSDGKDKIVKIVLPNTATSIVNGYVYNYYNQYSTFQHFDVLTSVTIPDGVTSIGYYAFFNCTSLTSITIPASVTSIGNWPFNYCSKLTAINVASGNNAFTSENGVLYNKDKTTLIQYPGGKKDSFTIPSSVTRIGGYAFIFCLGLTSVTIPDSVTIIESYAFEKCGNLTSVTFEGAIAAGKFGTDAFLGDLREKYLATGGGPGTYTRPNTGEGGTWTKTGGDVAPGGTYIITGSGASFTATNSGATIGTGAIQDVIDGIRTHASGKDLTIQFGNGTATLDIGTAYAEFNNSGGTWGAITLTGKITSAVNDDTIGTIYIVGSVSVTSKADIANTCLENYSNLGTAIYNNSTGTVSITDGTVSAIKGRGRGLYSKGTVTITGGTFSTAGGSGVANSGTLTITGGTFLAAGGSGVANSGTLTITGGTFSATTSSMGEAGTALLSSGTVSITGGTFSATSGRAVHNSFGTITISGGTFSATLGYPVLNSNGSGSVVISGGTVSSPGNIAVYNMYRGKITVSGTAKISSANTDISHGTIYLEDLTIYSNVTPDATTVMLEITGGTVENTSATTGNAVYTRSTGAVSITGGTVSKAGDGNYAVYKGSSPTVTIGPGATIVGNKNF